MVGRASTPAPPRSRAERWGEQQGELWAARCGASAVAVGGLAQPEHAPHLLILERCRADASLLAGTACADIAFLVQKKSVRLETVIADGENASSPVLTMPTQDQSREGGLSGQNRTLPVEAATMFLPLSAMIWVGVARVVLSPCPSCPNSFRPQLNASPPSPRAMICADMGEELMKLSLMLPRPARSRCGPKRLGAPSIVVPTFLPISCQFVEPNTTKTPSAGGLTAGGSTTRPASGAGAGGAAEDPAPPPVAAAAASARWASIFWYIVWAPGKDMAGHGGALWGKTR